MKKITLFLLFIGFQLQAQESRFSLGVTTMEELKMTHYEKDSTAVAVVLLDAGDTHHDVRMTNSLDLITDYYQRVKILKKEGVDRATVSFRYYGDEKILNISGVTYNLNEAGAKVENVLEKKDVFTKKLNESWSEVSFTLPNVQVGSVIEFRYSLRSPYFDFVRDWRFQSDIPVVASKYKSSILGNWKYNIRLMGFLKMDVDNPTIRKNCVDAPNYDAASCINLEYEMYDIPKFESEKYMSSKENYVSKLIFDLISYTSYERIQGYGSSSSLKEKVKKYTQTWEDADKQLRKWMLDGQTSKRNFFKKQLPANIFNESDPLKKSQAVFSFIQNHYNWNSRYISVDRVDVKKSFEEKVGSVDAINLALYNSLQAIDIESYPVVLSTRSNGFPTDLFPVINDFNYLIVKAIVNGKTYFLDAVDKYLAFGQVSFECLNGKVRVLDFDKGSYWEVMNLKATRSTSTRLNLNLNKENAFEGDMTVTTKGYSASDRREEFDSMTEEQYLEKIETQSPYLEIQDYKRIHKEDVNKPLQEKFTVTFFDDSQQFKYQRINPFFDQRFTENPFKLQERKYPVDFGAPYNYSYLLNLKIPEGYDIISIPENAEVRLPNRGGVFMLKVQKKENEVNVFMRYVLNKTTYEGEEYQKLKEFFNQIIKAQKSYIEVKPN